MQREHTAMMPIWVGVCLGFDLTIKKYLADLIAHDEKLGWSFEQMFRAGF